MTLLATVLLALGLSVNTAPATPVAPPAPIGEPLKAPIEITVPVMVIRHGAPSKSGPAANGAKPDPRAAAPAALKAPTPSPAIAATASAAPKDREVVASAAPLAVERQPGYALVERNCGRCHGMEKALNAAFSAADWDGYLKRKFRRAGAGITPEQSEEIGAFLRTWASQRERR